MYMYMYVCIYIYTHIHTYNYTYRPILCATPFIKPSIHNLSFVIHVDFVDPLFIIMVYHCVYTGRGAPSAARTSASP